MLIPKYLPWCWRQPNLFLTLTLATPLPKKLSRVRTLIAGPVDNWSITVLLSSGIVHGPKMYCDHIAWTFLLTFPTTCYSLSGFVRVATTFFGNEEVQKEGETMLYPNV